MVNKEKSVTYAYQGIVKNNSYLLPRMISALLKIPFFKKVIFSIPAIDEAVLLQNGNNKMHVEITPVAIGVFGKDWKIRRWILDRLKEFPVEFSIVHAAYVFGDVKHQSFSWTDLVLDITEDTGFARLAIKQHINLLNELVPIDKRKILVFHPLPMSPFKSELDVIRGIKSLLSRFTSEFKDKKIYIGIENMPAFLKYHKSYFPMLGSVDFFTKLMNELDHPNIGITFDWGHANSFARFMYNYSLNDGNFVFTPEALAKFKYQSYFLKSLKEKIYHLHLHYNYAHKLNKKPPWTAHNYDTHHDLTFLDPYTEFKYYKKNLSIIVNSPNLNSITLEIMPRAFAPANKYKDSVKILESMIK